MAPRASEDDRRLQLLIASVSDHAIYMLDPNGVITNWNTGAERIKGYRPDEVIGRHFGMFYTPDDRRAGAPARALETASREGRFETEGWRVRKDGHRFWASVVVQPVHDDDGEFIGFAKITRDISDKRAAQEALEQSERQFRLLIAGVTDYAIFMLDPNGLVANWNAGAEKIKGYTAEEIVGRHIATFYTEPDRAAGKPAQALRTAAEEGRYEAEAWRMRKDGTLFWANVVIDAIRDETGQLVGFAKITRDVTERREAQLELQRAHERLAQAQKMEAIGQLTGGVAHDFNNLLMVVSGQAQLLRRRLADDPRAIKALDAVDMATKRGQDLTRHLLAFARRQRLRPIAVSLNARADSVRELLSASLGSHVRLDFELPDDLWPVKIDPSELELALLNMAVNARDAMPGGGVLTISARNAALAGLGEAQLSGEFVVLTVRDTGQGIPPDILPRIFEPFFTTKEVNKGTGLGLSQVYGFAQQSGGHVTVESELGKGSSITIYLPRSQDAPAEADEAPTSHAARDARILVVEDNPEVAEVAAGLLEQLGNRTQIVNSAEAALRALEDGEPPDLVFSDVVMAGEMDGLALARRLRAIRPELPVLLATGYSQATERMADEFPILTKPYQLNDLSHAVGELLAERDARRENAERDRCAPAG